MSKSKGNGGILGKEPKLIRMLMQMYAFDTESRRDSIEEALQDAYRRGLSDGYEIGKRPHRDRRSVP